MDSDWNVIATARGGNAPALLRAVCELGQFRSIGSRNVIVGRVADRARFLERIRERLPRDLRLPACLGHVMPADRVVTLDLAAPAAALEAAVTELAAEVGARSYHVRVDVHGERGGLRPHQLERSLGAALWDALVRRGFEPRVRFEDAEVVLMVEIVNGTAGLTLIDRETAARYAFLRVR